MAPHLKIILVLVLIFSISPYFFQLLLFSKICVGGGAAHSWLPPTLPAPMIRPININ
jgi:hypothetical protein